MANKMHPGAFRCYEAALPDEPMFVLLGRDPAAPATMEFWANERVRQGKTTDTDDNARIGAALREADEMRAWRQKILDAVDPLDGVPAWKLPRPEEHGDDRPICMKLPNSSTTTFRFGDKEMDETFISISDEMDVSLAVLVDTYKQRLPVWSIQTYEKADPAAPGGRVIHAHPALGAPYGGYDNRLHTHRELMVSVGKAVREIAHELNDYRRAGQVNVTGAVLLENAANKLHAEVERLAEAARAVKLSDTDPYVEFAKNLDKPRAREWFAYEDTENENPVICHPLSFTRMAELLDYATGYGEFDENTPSGTEAKEPNIAGNPMNDMRRTAIWTYKRCMGIIGEEQAFNPPVADDAPSPKATLTIHTDGIFKVPGVEQPQSMEAIAEVYRKAAANVHVSSVKIAASRDITEIETPEMPPHRFAMFDKGEGWAYGRGLEINPSHIPAMLDRMEADGYKLVAALGSQADKVGMIFQRGPRYSLFELACGFSAAGSNTATAESPEDSEQLSRRKQGAGFDETTDVGYGNGQRP